MNLPQVRTVEIIARKEITNNRIQACAVRPGNHGRPVPPSPGYILMTLELFREDGYLKQTDATITAIEEHGVQLDQTNFYATGGGQPGDTGKLVTANGEELPITDTFKDRETGAHLHVIGQAHELAVGQPVTLVLDWDRRHRLMRMHSCMHMLCSLIDAPVTGGSIQDGRGRLDFDLAETLDKATLTEQLNTLISGNHDMTVQWITDQELDDNPELVRTLSVQPPRGSGRIRLVNFRNVDLQPCGGTHVSNTREIGPVNVRKIEKKGRQNRRVIVEFADSA